MAINDTINPGEELVQGTPAGESKSWNWHPEIPIKTSPLFDFPPNPAAIIKWYAGAWLPVTEFGIYLLLAIGVWFWLVPPLAEMKTLAVSWAGAIWVRNLFMMTAIASALHLWLLYLEPAGRRNALHAQFTHGQAPAILFREPAQGQYFLHPGERSHNLDFIRKHDVARLCQRCCARNNLRRASCLVCVVVPPDRRLAGVSFLLHSPPAALEATIRPLPLCASPQHHHRSLVRLFYASG